MNQESTHGGLRSAITGRNVHKFGGSSLANAAAYQRVASIIVARASKADVIVVSAAGSTTNQLIRIADDLSEQPQRAQSQLSELLIYQQQLITEVVPAVADTLIAKVQDDISGFGLDFSQLDGDYITSDRFRNDWLALGEVWSARLLATLLTEHALPSVAVDARLFLTINGVNSVDFERSEQAWKAQEVKDALHVVTGFIAKNSLGVNCTLGRNGSDYTATIMARIINAGNATIWTDVDGIYNADPRQIRQARKIPKINWQQAQTLSQLGNPVLHPNTLLPLAEHKCRLYVRSSIETDKFPTRICHDSHHHKSLTAITQLNRIVLLSIPVTDWDMIKQDFNDLWLLSAVEQHHTMLIAFHEESARQLENRLQLGNLSRATLSHGALFALVGEGDYLHHQFDQQIADIIDDNEIIAIDNSRDNASVYLIKSALSPADSHQLHHELFGLRKRVGLLIAGFGNIGSAFLSQFIQQQQALNQLVDLSLLGVFNSRTGVWHQDGIDCRPVLTEFEQNAKAYSWATLIEESQTWSYDELVLIDITSSEAFSHRYAQFFTAGFHIISANKHGNAAPLFRYQETVNTQLKHGRQWLANTTVGAGLPVNASIQDLRDSGDQITAISGIFSGTLSWLFRHYDGSQPFSALLSHAHSLGLTEPDPREDLSGRDIQRKLLILARLAGVVMDENAIQVTSLVPEELSHLDKTDFLNDMSALDDEIAQHWHRAQQHNQCLTYVAQFEHGKTGIRASVGLQAIEPDHPFATLTPGDNIFIIQSQWYDSNPLILRGPGAGKTVTAGGLHSDLAKLVRELARA